MKKLIGIGMLCLLAAGCGELSYKRGASAQDLQAAKVACRSATPSERAFEQCLVDQGWTVKQLDDVDLFASVGVNTDPRQPGAFVTPEFVPVTPATPTHTPTATVAPPTPVTPVTPAKPPITVAADAAPTVATTQRAVVDPLDLYAISSWWKMGADHIALAADTEVCTSQLGEAHKPRVATQQFTRGFIVCMHEQGWKALRAVAR